MEPERWRRVEELYHSALQVAAEERTGYLRQACGGDAKLCEEVESLLAYESSAKAFMEKPAFEMAAKQMARDEGDEDQADPVSIGATLQRFRVIEKLGVGGMGVVYKAEDTRLHRTVALKFLPKRLARDPASLERFEREAHAASALNHPNICTVYDIGEHEGQPFIAMELLEGQTLDGSIRGQPLSTDQVLTLGIQTTEGLHAAHQKGIIHRDIKPANIFVTSQGKAKILDFGLAKLAPTVMAIDIDSKGGQRDEGVQGASHGIEQPPIAGPLLSRTGVAMGTAGYMSPEQVRGEELDARTDLFSFGLVLYEMATGKRAFQGDSGPALHDDILKRVPTPARQLNPKLPAELEQIISRALEKDREARYQTASEMCSDLEALRHLIERKRPARWREVAVGVVLVGTIAGVAFWFAKRQSAPTQAPPNIKFRQLTLNSPENPVRNGSISPNGKYLAYVDKLGMHVKDTETGSIQDVAQPLNLKKDSVNWEIIDASWFPDNVRFLANVHPASEPESAWSSRAADIWVFSRIDEAPRKLREQAVAWSVSPDGAAISFGTNAGRLGERETWLMDPEGKQARKLFDTDENSSLAGFYWSADGRRELYFRTDASGDTLLSRGLQGGPPVPLLAPAETKQIRGDISWLPDGRLIYQAGNSDSGLNSLQDLQDSCDFWTLRLDVRTGRPVEKPRRLTNWTGFCNATSANATVDGKRLAFMRRAISWTVNVADADAGGTRMGNMRRLTLDESTDLPRDWTSDSKEVVFISNRTGQFAFYRQSLDEDAPERISTGTGSFLATLGTAVSPDGKWVLSNSGDWPGDRKDPKLLRIPIAGGSPELVTTTVWGSAISCARSPSSLCVLGEKTEDRKRMIFTSIDVLKGRGPELARFELDPEIEYLNVEISPDGTRLAVSGNPKGPIQILTLRDHSEQVIPAKFNNLVGDFHWAADGKGLYVPDQTKRGTELSYMDLHGNARVLWVNPSGWATSAMPSPDGRHLALQSASTPSNIWVMENF